MPKDPTSLGHQAVQGSIWSAVGSAFQLIFQFVIFAVLARLLGPRAFGIVSLAAVFIDFLGIIGRGGIAEVLVQRNVVTPREESTAFWTTLIFGCFMGGVIFLLASPISAAYGIKELSNVIIGLIPVCIFSCLSSTYEARLRREFRFRLIAWRNSVSSVVGGVAAFIFILSGFGIYSLVLQRLVVSVMMFCMMAARSGWRPTLEFSPRESVRQLRLGSGIVGCALLGISNQKVIDLIIGAVLGPTALGYLRISWRALEILYQVTIQSFIPVAMSAFSRLSAGKDKLRASYVNMIEATSIVMYPLCGWIIVFGADFIHIVFGSKWDMSILPMQVMAITGFIAPLFYYNGIALIAMGETRKVLIINTIEFIISAACAALMAGNGLVWAAASNVVRSVVFVPVSLWMMWTQTDLPMTASLKAAWKPGAATVISCGVAILARGAAGHVLPELAAGLFAGCLAVGAYSATMWLVAPDLIARLVARSPLGRFGERLGIHDRTVRRV